MFYLLDSQQLLELVGDMKVMCVELLGLVKVLDFLICLVDCINDYLFSERCL